MKTAVLYGKEDIRIEDRPIPEVGPGDRVLCGPPSHCAEDCPSYREGKTNICINGFPRTAGIGEPDGGYAEYMLIRDVEHTMIIPVPDGVRMEDAVLFDFICVALHGIRLSRFRIGDAVVVSGMGPVGLSAVQFLKAAGAFPVIALDVNDKKREYALTYGADYFLNSLKDPDVGASIREILGRPDRDSQLKILIKP